MRLRKGAKVGVPLATVNPGITGGGAPQETPRRICMLVLSPARTDARVMREASALVGAGYQVSIVDVEQTPRAREETVGGARLHHVFVTPRSARNYNPVRSLPWLMFKFTRIVRTGWMVVRMSADAYHAHDITALPACYLAARVRGRPLIFDAHELPLTQRHLIRRHILLQISRALLRLMMRQCAGAITVSPPLVQEMKALYGGPAATVVRNIPHYERPVDDDRLRQHLGLAEDARLALYQGGFQANRSLDLLVRAASYLAPGNVIVLMGAGESLPELERLISDLRVEDRVKIKSFVPHQDLLSWTSSADLGLCLFSPDESLSIRYCLPNKVFEYLMAGLPVLTTPLDAVVDLVRRYDVGSEISSLRPEVIGAGINALVCDAPALERMRGNALAACASALRWDKEQQGLIRLYERVVA